ncbi:ferrochelatase [Chitinophaga parva]|uniref:Ferrochelatase n=1 Tax=Chitinophaga parva TaxID=2169414 RepID=A0A2T7BPM0_9BACT|nr:ferrochelatase [Chitinophaga parva]PUZ29624.1 ferrochelatase [Chitinophaga parva]
MGATTHKAIILMNLGSPDSTEVPDVKRYLMEFLMDKKVIDYPYLLRLLLVGGIIVPRRAPQSAEAYKRVWLPEGSPLIVLTQQLQEAVQHALPDVPVTIAMRYGNPSPKAAYDELLARHPQLKEVILLPLYPHYAMSSYETAVDYAKEIHQKGKYAFKLTTIPPYFGNEDYIRAQAASMQPYLEQDYDYVLFSYHGVPERHIRKGDITHKHCLQVADCCHVDSPAHAFCYRHQVFVTSEKVAAALNIPEEKWGISFQSRLGKEQWLLPYTASRFTELPAEGKKKILVACPAFVSDCLETLEEIGMEGKHSFLESGGESFTMIPCMNLHPLWVQAIGKWCSQIIHA